MGAHGNMGLRAATEAGSLCSFLTRRQTSEEVARPGVWVRAVCWRQQRGLFIRTSRPGVPHLWGQGGLPLSWCGMWRGVPSMWMIYPLLQSVKGGQSTLRGLAVS